MRTRENQREPGKTRENQGEPGRTRENQGEPGRTRKNQGEPGRTKENNNNVFKLIFDVVSNRDIFLNKLALCYHFYRTGFFKVQIFRFSIAQ